jgi:hypothetical protein
VTFREKLIATLRRLQPVLEEPGVLVVGSEVPNLLQPDAASTLVVSQDVDLAVPVDRVVLFKRSLAQVQGLVPSADEPSVYVPTGFGQSFRGVPPRHVLCPHGALPYGRARGNAGSRFRPRSGDPSLSENRGDIVSHKAILDRMHARAHAVRTRALVRRWKYRQRNLAAGVWFHVRRALAGAKEAYVISDSDARELLAEGYTVEPCGTRLEPEKTIIVVDSNRLRRLDSCRRIAVNLGPDFLLARTIALVSFDSVATDASNTGDGS